MEIKRGCTNVLLLNYLYSLIKKRTKVLFLNYLCHSCTIKAVLHFEYLIRKLVKYYNSITLLGKKVTQVLHFNYFIR